MRNQTGLLPLEKSDLPSPPTFSLQILLSTESGKESKRQVFIWEKKMTNQKLYTVLLPTAKSGKFLFAMEEGWSTDRC